MASTARRLKANRKIENQQCIWCGAALALGADAAVCEACESPHHATCWDEKGGCAKLSCANAPLRRIAEPVAAPAAPVATDRMSCPRCGRQVSLQTEVCPYCKAITSPDGIYHGPKTNAPGAVASVVWGCIGLFVCGVVLGFVAISQANSAKRMIDSDPRYGGEGFVTAGRVLGVLSIVGWVIYLFGRMASV